MSARSKTLPEMPKEQIKEVVARHPEVQVTLKRRNAKGQWGTLPQQVMTAGELPGLEEHIREQHGGGSYRVLLLNTQNQLEELVTPFMVEIEGPMKSTSGRPQNGGGPVRGSYPFPQRPGVPSYAQLAAQKDGGNELNPSDFMSHTPDTIALQQVTELRAELKEARAERTRERKETEARLERERERARELERERDQDRIAHEKALMELRFEMMTQANARPEPRPATDYVGLAAAVVPVVTAMISTSKDRQALQQNAQQKSMELQVESTKAMFASLSSGSKKGDDSSVKMIESLAPLVLPFITQMMEEKSPSKMVEVLGAMGENQMATLSLVSQFVSSMAGESDNPWMEVAKQALGGIQNVAEQMVDMTQQQQGKGPVSAQVVGQPQAQTVQQPFGPNTTPAQFADALFNSPGLPEELRTEEWYNIFVALHDKSTLSSAVAQQLGQHLEALADAGRFPAMFGPMMESDKVPSTFVRPFLQQLPLSQANPARMEAILRELDDLMESVDESEDSEQEESSPDFAKPQGQVFDAEGETISEPVPA